MSETAGALLKDLKETDKAEEDLQKVDMTNPAGRGVPLLKMPTAGLPASCTGGQA